MYEENARTERRIDLKNVKNEFYVNWANIFNLLHPNILIPSFYEAKYGFQFFKQMLSQLKIRSVLSNFEFTKNAEEGDFIDGFRVITTKKSRILFLGVLCNEENYVSIFLKLLDTIKSLR